MKRARVLAGVSAMAAVGCLWLFPIQKDEAKSTSSGTSMEADSGNLAGGSGSEMMPMDDAGQCTANSDCGQDFTVCRAHTCLPLRTSDCILVRGNWNDPNAFIFGAYATEPVGVPEKSQAIYNYELAINELNAVGGLPDSSPAATRHPIAAVICNNDPKQALADPDFYSRSLHHLVDELGVSAIVADLSPDQLQKAWQTTKDEGKSVFFLSPGAADAELFSLKDDGLVWNMLGPPSDLAGGYADLVRRIESYVRASGDAGAAPLRVALVREDDPSEVDHELLKELYGAVLPKLFFNAASATSQMGGNYQEFLVDKTRDGGLPSDLGDAINDFAPHIVISMTGTDFTSIKPEGVAHRMLTFVKGGGADRTPWVNHEYPFFVFSPINAAATGDFSGLLLSSTALDFRNVYQRFLGITIAGADDRDLYGEYLKRLQAYQMQSSDGYENYYDAIYYLAYAVYAAGVDPVDGRKISAGMSSLSNGTPERVGPTGTMADGGTGPLIEGVFQELKAHGSVLLIGAGGSQFDVSHGVRIDKAGLYCFGYNNGNPPISHQPAEIFDAQTQKWTVIAQCAQGL